jgi:hypothetical protein
MRYQFGLLIAFYALVVFCQQCHGEIVLDQSWPVNSSGVWQFISETVGEIADVTTTGKLDHIVVSMNVSYPGSIKSDVLDWYILSVANGLPVTTLATGAIPTSEIGPTATIDVSSANLNFVSGNQFAFAFHGQNSDAQFSWYSYYGSNAPFHRSIVGNSNGSSWAIEPDFYNPTYIGAFSSYFEVVPEPSTLTLLALGAIAAFSIRRRIC